MAWGRRKSGPKSAKNQPLCPVSAIFSLSLSLSAVPATNQSHHQLLHHHLHHRKPTQPPTDHQEPLSISLSSLQPLPFSSSFFASFATDHISVTASATVLTSAPPRINQLGLHLGTLASGSAAPFVPAIKLLHAEHAVQLLCMVAGSGQQPYGPGPNHLSSARPKKRKKRICWAEIGPLFSGFMPGPVIWASPAHLF